MLQPTNIIKYLLRVIICVSVLFAPKFAISQTVTLKIIETTDVHGAIFPYDFISNRPASGSLAQVQTYLNLQRQVPEQEVILLSGGDILQGQPAVYFYNFEKPETTHLYARVMNYLAYDAGAVGNHDIETGHVVYDKFRQELEFPWLAANAVNSSGNGTYFQPYSIIKKKGVKIAVLGMVTPWIPQWLPPKIWQGMIFQDMIETARHWIPFIRHKEQPDLIIGLFHSGVDFTYGESTADTPRNENASQLVAEQVPGFDIIFVGHEHVGWNKTVSSPDSRKVHILGATAHARDVAVATVTMVFDQELQSWQKTISGELVSMKDFAPDSIFMSKFVTEFEEVKNYVSRPIGEFTTTISAQDALFGDSPFVDLVHRIQLELTGADVSVSAPLSLNAAIKKGRVYVRDMFKLYKFENLLYTMNLSGKEIQDFMEYSYGNWFNRMKSADDHLLNFQKDDDGKIIFSKHKNSPRLITPSYNYDSIAGLNYVVDISRPAGKRIHILAFTDGRLFDPLARYKVAINSYRGNGGGGHLTKGAGIAAEELSERIISSTEKDLRYFLMKWIEKQGPVTAEAYGNWRVIPLDLWENGKKRDYKLLYGDN